MAEAFIVDTVRTPVGKRGGTLSQIHPADLGAITLNALMDRTGIDPAAVEAVVMGCLDTIGPQAGDIARTAWLAAGLPETTPGVTIDRQCGSSQQAVHFAAQAVMAGVSDVVVAAGVQNMSMIPISSAMTVTEGMGLPEIFAGSEGWAKRFGDQEISQFRGADLIAEQWGISREDMEAFAVESHTRAIRATEEGRFEREIVPVNGLARDEGPREPNWEKIRSLKTLREGGRITAAVSSQISDASAAMLIVSEQALKDHDLTPRARILAARLGAEGIVWSLRGSHDGPLALGTVDLLVEAGELELARALITVDEVPDPAEPPVFARRDRSAGRMSARDVVVVVLVLVAVALFAVLRMGAPV